MMKTGNTYGQEMVDAWKAKSDQFALHFGNEDFVANHADIAGISFEEYTQCHRYWTGVLKPAIVEKYPDKYIRQMIGAILCERLKYFKSKAEDLILLNDDLRNKGVSFVERKQRVVDKMSALGKVISDYEELLKGYRVSSLGDVITPDTAQDIKKMGIKKFLEFYFNYICHKN